MRCGALVTRLCGAVAAVHCTCGGYDDSCHQARLSAVSDPLSGSASPSHSPHSTLSCLLHYFRVTPDIMDGGGWCWQPVSVRRSSQLSRSRTQAVHPEPELQSTVTSRRLTGELGLWTSFIILTGPPLLWPRAVLGLSSKLELVLYLLKTGNLAPTCTYK